MKNNKLYALYHSLNDKEVKLIQKALESPLHNQEAATKRLFEWLGNPTNSLTKENAYAYAYADRPFDNGSFYALSSRLVHIIEKVLLLKDESRIGSELELMKLYRRRKLSKHFKQSRNKTEKLLSQSPLENNQYHFQKYQLATEQFEMFERETRSQQTNLQKITNHLNTFLISEKLRWAVTMQSHSTVYKSEYVQVLLPHILSVVEQGDWLDIPSIAVYYYCYKAMTEKDNDAYFKKLKAIIHKSGSLFPPKELKEIYTIAINFGVKKINSGHPDYLKEIFELYQKGLEDSIFFDEGTLSRWSYSNIMSAALKLGEFSWAEQFISEYKGRLKQKYRGNIYNYNLARLHYHNKEYKQAMQLLNAVELRDILLNLSAKVLLLKMYVELNENKALESLLFSLKIYLMRNKVIGYHKKNYNNIIRFTKRLSDLNPYNRAAKEKLIEDIKETDILTEREWLLGRLDVVRN